SQNSRRLDPEVYLIHSFELFGDHPQFSRPSRLCARVQWGDDTLYRTRAYKEYTRYVF
ncbi:hypothetical protein Tco_1117032, partial [Tanacetum coccineum]